MYIYILFEIVTCVYSFNVPTRMPLHIPLRMGINKNLNTVGKATDWLLKGYNQCNYFYILAIGCDQPRPILPLD